MGLWSRIRNVFRGDLNDDIDAELQSHFDEAQAAGRDPLEMRRAFGSRLRVRETARDVIVAVSLESLLLDLLVLAALIAAAIPARRAASVDPADALRAE